MLVKESSFKGREAADSDRTEVKRWGEMVTEQLFESL